MDLKENIKNGLKGLLFESKLKLIDEELKTTSLQKAIDSKFFGPVYHGTTQERLKSIQDKGFEIYIGSDREGNIRNGYPNQGYSQSSTPPPIHHLGYGIYFTTKKSIAKNFNDNSMKGIKPYYLDVSRLETVNFASPKKMMDWWISNGYDPELAKVDRVKATINLTNTLKNKFDAIWFKGTGGLNYKVLDGDQIVVFDTSRIYSIDDKLNIGKNIGATVVAIKDIKLNNHMVDSPISVNKGTKGIIIRKDSAQKMRDFWKTNGNETEHWSKNSDFVYGVKFKNGGILYNILDDDISEV
jgi:hypothetical protein